MTDHLGEPMRQDRPDPPQRRPRSATPVRRAVVGRRVELQELAAALDRAAGGAGVLAFIEGEAGIGKTFLLEEALTRAETMGFRCFTGAAEELECHRPFGAIAESLGIGRRGHLPGVALPGEEKRRLELSRTLVGNVAETRMLAADTSGSTQGAGRQDAIPGDAAGDETQAPHEEAPRTTILPGSAEAEFRIVDALVD